MYNNRLVFQSDFGLVDGAVAAMMGVATGVDDNLHLYNLTHDISQYNIWEASYRLYQTIEYWPEGTVFVSVVDPGVGSDRKACVALTEDGKYIVTPDNGSLTHIKKFVGIKEVREIEGALRRKGSHNSYTFHGRDIFAYIGAKLASGRISLEEVGQEYPLAEIVSLEMGQVEKSDGGIKGTIDILDVRFGSLWTDISREDFLDIGFDFNDEIEVKIHHNKSLVYNNRVRYGKSFADVYVGESVIYVNSLDNMALAINQGNFAKAYNVGTGISWTIEFNKIDK